MNFDKLRKGVAEAGDLVFAEQLLRSGAATPEQVQSALEEKQRTPGLNLGQILLKKGWITTDQYVDVLRHVEEARPTPRKIGRYLVESELARGGMGIVYRGMDPDLKRPVAIKVLKSDDREGSGAARLRREAQAAAKLRHPNIVTVHEVGEDDGLPYLVMDLVEGSTLRKAVGKSGWPPEKTAALLADVADALHEAHRAGVVHRDLKPENILVDAEGRPRVSDFGLARLDQASVRLTKSNEVMGTPLYMAPEQMTGQAAQVGPRTDVYALGVVLYELVAGRLPYDGDTFVELCRRALEGDPPAPSTFRKDADPDLQAIALKAMSLAPADRYSDAAALAADLRRRAEGEPILARPPSPIARVGRKASRHKAALAIAGVAILAMGVAVAVRVSSRNREADLERRLADSIRKIEDLADRAVEKYEYAQMGPPRPLDREEEELEGTLRLLETTYRDNPGAHEALVAVGKVQSKLGRHDAALRSIDEGIARLAERATGRHHLARALARFAVLGQPAYRSDVFTEKGGHERRRALLEAARADLARAGGSAGAAQEALLKALAAFAAGDGEACRAACDRAAGERDAPPVLKADVEKLRGDSWSQDGRSREALAAYEAALAIKRCDKQVLFDAAWTLSRSGTSLAGYQDGLSLVAQIEQISPSWGPGWLVRGLLWTESARRLVSEAKDPSGAFAEAATAFERLLQLAPGDPLYLGYRSYFHYSRGFWRHFRLGRSAAEDVAAAIRDADAAVEGLPHLVLALHSRSSARSLSAQAGLGDPERDLAAALRDLDAIVAGSPDSWSARYDRADQQHARAQLLADPPRKLEAIGAGLEDLDVVLRLKPSYARAHWMRGKFLTMKAMIGNKTGAPDPEAEDAALASFDVAVRLSPGDYSALLSRGDLRIQRALRRREAAELEPALADLAESVRLAPTLGITHATYAQALQSSGRFETAVAEYEKAFELDPSLKSLVGVDYERCKSSVVR